jgi:hypothetical protein
MTLQVDDVRRERGVYWDGSESVDLCESYIVYRNLYLKVVGNEKQ